MFVNVFLYHFEKKKREERDEQTAEQRLNHFATGLPQESMHHSAAQSSHIEKKKENMCTSSSKLHLKC